MRTALAVLVLVTLIGAASGRDDAAVTPRQLIANPAKYKGEIVVVRRIRCVDPGGAKFLCEAASGADRLQLNASVLGAITEQSIAEKLVGLCKGQSALTRPACTFDVVLTPTGFGSNGSVIVIYAAEIDLSKPHRP
ncbi:hypothetical protein MKK68_19940 [Methylobacterium sp. E-016]|uniref:hypothetical protein n=1 Tax=Methylobacterium sp. E-016 TaxID=2836556 RepID=UPI001FBB1D3E|nr:hypothetical protein [Methylobacterium sp. E-016]MCJ2077886.1 hypothetical protein [Methylobacterium sp. E-016]